MLVIIPSSAPHVIVLKDDSVINCTYLLPLKKTDEDCFKSRIQKLDTNSKVQKSVHEYTTINVEHRFEAYGRALLSLTLLYPVNCILFK